MKTQELFEQVTQSIIRDLEKGVASWVRPWTVKGGGIMPRNYTSKRYYSGVNVLILWNSQITNGYPESTWLTYKQAREIGAQVRGGEKSTRVIYTSKMIVGEGDDERSIGYMKQFFVFNVAQIDGLPQASTDGQVQETSVQKDAKVDAFIRATKADIRHGGDHAFYRIKDDFIMLPEVSAFESYEHYLATALHELVHFSGHPSRLDRQLGNRFGTKEYAAEELVAEFGAAFLCAHLGVEGRLRHSEYIREWVSLLKDDPKAIVTAASQASKAADYLRTFSENVEQAA